MSHTTNVLLAMVVLLLVAIFFGSSSESKVYADGSASSDSIIFTTVGSGKEVFLVNVDKSIMLHYRVGKGFQLKGARRFDYDVQLPGTYDGGNGNDYETVRSVVMRKK